MIRYFHSEDDLPIAAAPLQIDDESSDWWGGVQKCFTTIALATVLATAAASTAIASTLQWQDEIPAGSLYGQPDEDFWQNPVVPVPASIYQRFPYLPDPEEIPAGGLFGQFDEDFWALGPPSVPAKIYQSLPYLPDAEEIPAGKLFGQADEDFWKNAVAPVPATLQWPQQWTFDVQEPAGNLFGQADEDFWNNPVRPVPATLLPLQQWPFDSQEPTLFGQYDEDFWVNPVRRVWAYPPPLVFSDDEIVVPQPAAFIPDEDFWVNPVPPVQGTNLWPQPSFDSGEGVQLYGPQEDYWFNFYQPIVMSFYQSLPYGIESANDEMVPQPGPGPSPVGRSARFGLSFPSFR